MNNTIKNEYDLEVKNEKNSKSTTAYVNNRNSSVIQVKQLHINIITSKNWMLSTLN